MKKLLVGIITLGVISVTFADTPVDFDKKRIECMKTKKKVKLNDIVKISTVIKSCKIDDRKPGDSNTRLRFVDDLSHKQVYCDFDSHGTVKVGTCYIVE